MNMRFLSATFAVGVLLIGQALAANPTNAPAAPPATTEKTDPVVARVNGKEIKRQELDAAVQAFSMQLARRGRPVPPGQQATLEHDVLEELIGRELLRQEGSRHPPANLDKNTQEQVEATKKQLGGDEQFAKTLAEGGLTISEYTQRVRDNLIIKDTLDQFVEKQVKITPEDIKAYYDQNPEQFKQPENVRASHILIRVSPDASADVKKDKRAQIDAARTLVKGGSKFADVAKKASEDPGSGANGGDLGFFPRGAMVPEFDAVAFSLKTNELSDVITTQFGYHILMVTDKKPAQTMPFEQVKEELTTFLKQRQGADIARNHVAELRKAGKVEVLLPSPPAAPRVETPPVQAPVK